MANPAGRHWGFELMKCTGLASGTIYPLLARLEGFGWLDSGWDEQANSGPRRRYYQLTQDGAVNAHQALAEASWKANSPTVRPAWKPALGGGSV
jgi:DNA-binding PadR family transcriptional regulator